MAITLDATVGGASANSFNTEAELLAYAETKQGLTGFTGALTDDEKKAAIQATRTLSSLSWVGRQSTDTQALPWPRWDACNPDSAFQTVYASDVIPKRVKDAHCELTFIAASTDITAPDSTLGIKRKKVDVLETEYFEPYQRAQGLRRWSAVYDPIAPLLQSAGNTVRVVRG